MVKTRNITAYDQLRARYDHAPRRLSFAPGSPFGEWKLRFKEKVRELIGPLPEAVPLNLEVTEELHVDDFVEAGMPPFTQQRVVYDTDSHSSCVAYLLLPDGIGPGERRPGIVCAHGHGAGKRQMIGLDPSTWMEKGGSPPGAPNFEATAVHLVKLGYVVIAPDWRAFGERALDPEYTRRGRDGCNVLHMGFGYFGFTLLGLNMWDAMRSVDVLQSLPEVDPGRIGMVGKSYGGTMTTYTAALDDRVKAACISGYLSTLDDAMSRRGLGNYCGAQYLPGLLEWGDIPDVVGLIAPKPLLIEAGERDSCFAFPDTTRAHGRLVEIYTAAGHPERLDRDVADVEHDYIFKKLPDFFAKHL
ncbi:MAG: acetylxylan esterase [Candidatus Lokiarchaeota archaeon]|nr:acetylxylan esterase [Candidatus Lokiarchaeota archaeon]